MNNVTVMGRLTREPEIRYSTGEKPIAIARYTLAVDKQFKREGEPTADYIPCVCFGKTAEFAEKYLSKGKKIALTGSLQSGSYQHKEKGIVYTLDLLVNNHYFCESKNKETSKDGYSNSPYGREEENPLN